MKKSTKKLITLCLTAIFSVNCLSMTAFANEMVNTADMSIERMEEAQAELDSLDFEKIYQQIDWENDAVTYSEYDIYESLGKIPSVQLSDAGYTDEEIATIYDFRTVMDEHIIEMATLNDSQLRDFGYTDSQINAIRNYDGSDEALSRASANANVSLDIHYCTYNSSTNRTSSRVFFAFSWNGQPAIKLKDMMTVGWNEWYQAGKSANVQYKYIYGGSTTKNQTPTYVEPSSGDGYGGGYKFNAAIEDNYYYAQNGYCSFVIDTSGERDIHATGVLAHQTIALEPSFSVTVSGTGVAPIISIKLVNTSAEATATNSRRVTR